MKRDITIAAIGLALLGIFYIIGSSAIPPAQQSELATNTTTSPIDTEHVSDETVSSSVSVSNLDEQKSETTPLTQPQSETEIVDTRPVSSEQSDTPQSPEYFLVNRVIDGDTVEVTINGEKETLRLIGINTPETKDPRKPVECFGVEASNRAKELLAGKFVRLEGDDSQDNRDKYGRLLRYVFLKDGTHYNKHMIEQGYAYEYTYQVPYQYQSEFKSAQRSAQENERGLWSTNTCNGSSVLEQPDQISPTNTPSEQEATETPVLMGKWYTSSHYSAKYYYCESDEGWKGLSSKYLKSFNTEAELLSAYPDRSLHEPCI